MNLFTETIANWNDWAKVYQSKEAFAPLVERILKREGLPAARITNLSPGTNAVFRAGDYVVKIYAPPESGWDQSRDRVSELFATKRAESLGIPVPKFIANGAVDDKYKFLYLISEYIEGVEFYKIAKTMPDGEKYEFGRRLRSITDAMNTPCEPFNGIDAINDRDRWKRWDKYPERFRVEREEYIKNHDFGAPVFVHGDFCGDNIIISPDSEIYIIDFADAVLAPAIYERALVASNLFAFDGPMLRGYYGEQHADVIAEECFNGLLIHDYGGDIVADVFGKPENITGLDVLKKLISAKVREKYET